MKPCTHSSTCMWLPLLSSWNQSQRARSIDGRKISRWAGGRTGPRYHADVLLELWYMSQSLLVALDICGESPVCCYQHMPSAGSIGGWETSRWDRVHALYVWCHSSRRAVGWAFAKKNYFKICVGRYKDRLSSSVKSSRWRRSSGVNALAFQRFQL